jgi:hypothetical protein
MKNVLLGPFRAILWLLDHEGDLILAAFGPQNQIRLGVIMTNMGIVFCLLVVKTDEPPLIFEMSALALLFGGIGVVVTAVLAKVTDENNTT